jgi:sugar phosphate isomerase/epimerase
MLEASHAELAVAARTSGCDFVSLFVQVPGRRARRFPMIETLAQARSLSGVLDGEGVSVWNLEALSLAPGLDLPAFAASCEIAAALGARSFTALKAHAETESDAAAAMFAAACELAGAYGLRIGLEPYRFSGTRTLGQAAAVVAQAGRPNGRVTVDILHMVRNGDGPAELAALDPALVPYAQICDGPLVLPQAEQPLEAVEGRLAPGEGGFPLADYLRALPPGVVLDVEAPNAARSAGRAADWARDAVAATREIVAASGRTLSG